MSALYTSSKKLLLDGDLDLLADDVRAVLVSNGYVFNAAHAFLSSVVVGNRVSTSGALTGKSTTGGVFDADNVVYSLVSGSAVNAIVLYRHTGNEATSDLIAYIDGISVVPNGGDINLNWNASGIMTLV